MSDNVSFDAEVREQTGKGPGRRLRMQGRIPAIIYGGTEPPQMISLLQKDVLRELTTNARFFSSICELKMNGKTIRTVPREAQLHPVSDFPLHVDFLRATTGAQVTVEVPVHFINEETCPGIKRGGVLNIVRREIELVSPIESIPDQITVDLGEAQIGDSIHISAVTLPSDVQLTITDRDFTICTIVGRGGGTAEGDEEGEGAEGEAGEE